MQETVTKQLPMSRWRNCATAVSSEGQRAKIPHNYRGWNTFNSVSLSANEDERINSTANVNNSVLAKNPWRSWMFWAEPKPARMFTQPRRTIRVASEILGMNPTLRYFLSLTLKLARNQFHASSSKWCEGCHSRLKRTLIEFLSKIILTVTTSVTWWSKFSAVFWQRSV